MVAYDTIRNEGLYHHIVNEPLPCEHDDDQHQQSVTHSVGTGKKINNFFNLNYFHCFPYNIIMPKNFTPMKRSISHSHHRVWPFPSTLFTDTIYCFLYNYAPLMNSHHRAWPSSQGQTWEGEYPCYYRWPS